MSTTIYEQYKWYFNENHLMVGRCAPIETFNKSYTIAMEIWDFYHELITTIVAK